MWRPGGVCISCCLGKWRLVEAEWVDLAEWVAEWVDLAVWFGAIACILYLNIRGLVETRGCMGIDMRIWGLMHTIFRGIVGANVQAVWASRGNDRAVEA